MDYYRNPNAATPGLIIRDVGLLILRVGMAVVIAGYHGWHQALAGWNFFWKKEPWSLLDVLGSYGLPVPQVVAVITVLILVLCSLGLLFGILSRLSAALLLAVAIAGIVLTFFEPMAEKFWLYGIMAFVLLICGPGCFSLAHLLNRR
jgi:uncharacterized membrane protein YphA (DoxX/SURF4 family)